MIAAAPPLAGLVHNAGALPSERTESAQGHEITMALHVLGPVLLTELLQPLLAEQRARVVFVTSGGMYAQPLPVSGAGKILKADLRQPFWEGRASNV